MYVRFIHLFLGSNAKKINENTLDISHKSQREKIKIEIYREDQGVKFTTHH